MSALELRAGRLERVGALLGRGVPLEAALGDGPDVAPGAALAREGRPLGDVLLAAGLIETGEAPLVTAAEGRDGGRGLLLLGRELRARAAIDRTIGEAIRWPVRKLVVTLAVVLMVGAALSAEVVLAAAGTEPSGLDPFGRPSRGIDLTPGFAGGAAVVAALVGLLLVALRAPIGRRTIERAARDVPVVSTLLGLEVAARTLRVLGTALAAGLDLPRALERVRDAFPGRQTGREADALVRAAREGAGLVSCLGRAPFVPPTAQWVAGLASERADAPRELLDLADEYEARLVRECAHWAPVLSGVADAFIVAGIGLPIVQVTQQLRGFY